VRRKKYTAQITMHAQADFAMPDSVILAMNVITVMMELTEPAGPAEMDFQRTEKHATATNLEALPLWLGTAVLV